MHCVRAHCVLFVLVTNSKGSISVLRKRFGILKLTSYFGSIDFGLEESFYDISSKGFILLRLDCVTNQVVLHPVAGDTPPSTSLLPRNLFSSTNNLGRIMRIPVGSASGTPYPRLADENVSSRCQQLTAGHKLSDIRKYVFRHEHKAVCRPRVVSNRHSSNCPSSQLARFWS